jgi:inosine-uridine nucleoside N-ribohydrolase
MKKILLDCDPGIDDSIAIILALKSTEVSIQGITSATGNLRADRTGVNIRKTLELMNRTDVPVAQGLMRPLVCEYPLDPFSHGNDGLGNTELPEPRLSLDPRSAPDFMADIIHSHPHEITIVATAPLTNIAFMLLKEPAIAQLVNELVLIGGSFGFNRFAFTNATGGNPVSEWNIFVDPDAAKIVFHSGMNITAIGLDVATHPDINLLSHHRTELEHANNPESEHFLKILKFLDEKHFQSYCALIDSLAVAFVINPDLIQTQEIHVEIETQSQLTRGQTVTDHRDNFKWQHLPIIRAASNANFEGFHDLLITKLSDKKSLSL